MISTKVHNQSDRTMIGDNQQLVTNEPVKFEI